MIIKARALIRHLRRVYCGGLIGEAVFQPEFKTVAVAEDQTLLVLAPELEGIEPLPCDVGVIDIARLIHAGETLGKHADDLRFSYDLARHELVVGTKEYGAVHLVTGSPWVIGTKAEDHTIHRLLEAAPSDEYYVRAATLDPLFVLSRSIRTDIIGIRFSRLDGRLVMGSAQCRDYAILPFNASPRVGPDFWLWFDASVLIPVLKQLDDYTAWSFRADGPGSLASFTNGKFLYLLSPLDDDPRRNREWDSIIRGESSMRPYLLAPSSLSNGGMEVDE